MENKLKRFMSLTLALLMVFSMMPQISLGVKAASETKTVYFQNNWLWTDVRCYYWNDGTSSSWPGDAMTFVENDGTYDIYKAEIPANAYIIFNGIKNDNSGSRDQTPDMTSWDACAVYYMYWNNGNTVKTDSKKHSYTSVVTAPDCVNAGYTTYTCSSCGDSYTEAGEAATGHTYEKGGETCDNCDEPNPNYVAPVTPAAPTLTEAQLNDTILITWKHTAADGAASTNGTYFTRGEIVKSEDGVYTCTLTMTQETLNSQAQGYVTTFDEVHSTHAHALPTDFPTEGGLSFTLTWDAANSEWTYEGVTYTLTCTEKAPGSGTLGTSYISESDDRATIYGEVTGMTNAKESIVVKLYSGETLLATTTLANLDYLSSETLGVNIVISGRASSSWNTVWEEGHPVASHCPDKAVLYIDGVEQNTANVTLGTIDDLGEPYVWAEIEGVSPVIYKVTTYEELVAALETENAWVLMMNDITGTATQSSGYGKAGIVLNAGDVLDGNGYTLTINGANSTWDCAIAMKGGEVKNLTIAGAMRGVFMPGANGDVVIDNCVFKDVIYTFNSDAGSKDYSVTIKNTILNGWTSFSDVHGSVTFDSCSFGEGSDYAFCRPYQATTFTNCSFAEGFKLDTTQTADNTLAFNSCTYAGEAISAANSAMFYNGGSVMINGVATDVTNYPAYIGETGYETVAAALAAAVDDDEVVINEAGTYSVPTGKDITITGAVEGVKFDMSKAVGINSSMTFNNVTFEYGNANYVGLQHAGTMVYNNCTINGQVFLYGTSETFNNCTFNQTSSDAYNVWTYGAKNVAFNECTFNSAGKSVLIYSEQSDLVNNVTVTKCEFKASTTVSGKAAIEMDSSLTSGINLTIEGETTATGFDKGSVSGDSLWNNKKDNKTEANNDITVTVDNVVVLRPITGSITPGYTSQTAIWGEGGGNAEESLVIELYVDETKIATSSLNNIGGIIDGDVYVTWSIPFAGSTDEYWTVQWEEGYPNKNEQPTTVKMIVDGKTVAENEVQMNGPDNLNPVVWEELDYFKPDVAKIGENYYKTVADALTAANDGDTIELISGENVISMAGAVVGGKTVTITGTAIVDWTKGNLWVGRNGEGDGKVIFDGANITSSVKKNPASTGIHVSGSTTSTTTNNGVLVIKDSNIELDYLINRNETTIEGSSNVTIYGGIYTHGRAADESASGKDETAALTIGAGSTVTVVNENSMGVGGESNGIMTVKGAYNANVLNVSAKGIVNVDGGSLNITGTLTNNGVINVSGESTLTVPTLKGETIDFLDGAVIKDSTVGGGVFVAGNVTFRGDNTFSMIYDYGTLTDYYGTTAPMAWTVEKGASVTMTEKARYGLGYGDKVTIIGSLTDADLDTVTEEDRSFFTHGLVAQESKDWNCDSSLTVKDAYVTIGSNNSFGNKSGNYGGNYTFTFENVAVDGSRITFYEALSTSTFTFTDSDVKTGTFMTRDADSVFTLNNTTLVSTTATNGTDEGNYHAGTLVLNNSNLTYSAPLVMENGTLTLGAGSTLTAPSITGTGKLIIDATGMTAGPVATISGDASGFTGTIEVINNDALEASINDSGKIVLTEKVPEFENAGIQKSSGKVRITADIYDLYNVDTFEAKLYDQNGELLTTVTPAVELNYAETTLSIMILGDSSSWDQTDWTPTSAQRPDYIEIWVNGELAATVDVRDNVVGMGELTQEKWDALLGKYYPVAKIGDTGYATLQAAIDAAVNGDTITLVADCAEDVTVVQAENVKITIDGNSKTMSGTITVNGQSHAYDTAGLTIKNVKFDATNISKDASINLGGSNNTRYTNHVTVEDCSFTGTDNAKVGIKNYTGGCKNLTVTDCTATGLHSLIQVKGVDGITVTNVTVENCKNGISVGPSTNVVIENANITAEGYGIRADGTAAYNVTVKNSTISAGLPIVVRNNTAEGYNLTLEGTNSLAASNENGYQVIFTSGDDGTYEVPAVEFNLTGAEGLKVFPAYVAQIGDVKYGTVTEAVEAAKPGDTIELIADAEEASVILLDGINLDLNGHTLTVTGYIAAYDGNNIIDTDGNGLLKITKGKIMIQDDNTYLPIWDDTNKGYVFASCVKLNEQTADIDNGEKYIFLPELAVSDYELIAKGIEVSGVTLKVEVSWTRSNGTLGSATFTYTDELVQAFYNSYDAEEGEFGSAFILNLTGTEGKTLSYKVYFVSDTGVTYECN